MDFTAIFWLGMRIQVLFRGLSFLKKDLNFELPNLTGFKNLSGLVSGITAKPVRFSFRGLSFLKKNSNLERVLLNSHLATLQC